MSVRIERGSLARTKGTSKAGNLMEFDADAVRAPFTLRCGAVLIDYILLTGILVVSSLIARGMGGGARLAGSPLNTVGLLIAVGATAFNFLILPWTRGRTIGKWATGLRIVTKEGEPIGIGAVLLRHVIGYPLSLIPLGAGFLVAAFNHRGRALHDYLAGTMVVTGH